MAIDDGELGELYEQDSTDQSTGGDVAMVTENSGPVAGNHDNEIMTGISNHDDNEVLTGNHENNEVLTGESQDTPEDSAGTTAMTSEFEDKSMKREFVRVTNQISEPYVAV